MLNRADLQRIEDNTGITPQQVHRLERMGLAIVLAPDRPQALAVDDYRSSPARRPTFGCASEAH